MLPKSISRPLTTAEIEAYHRDGAAVLKGVLDLAWVETMAAAVDRVLADPGDAAIEYTDSGKKGRYYGDFFVWMRDPDFRAMALESPAVEIAARVMGCERINFFYDQLLVKEPNTLEQTPWHQDLPYWPVRGEDIMSVWVPFDAADKDSGVVQYIKGSHRWGKVFRPVTFSDKSGVGATYADSPLEPMPDIQANLDNYDVIYWDMQPGDVLIHHPLTLHFAEGNLSPVNRRRGLALRYTGDDALFDERPGTFTQFDSLADINARIGLRDGDPIGGEVFPQVWPRNSLVRSP